MSISLRISLLIGIAVYVLVILGFLKKKTFSLKYSLLWLLSALVLLILTVFPRIAYFIADILGIESVVNAVFLIFVFFILLLLISLTAIATKQHSQIKSLTQAIATMDKKLRDLAEQDKPENK